MANILLNTLGGASGGSIRHLAGLLPALRQHDSGHRLALVAREALLEALGRECTAGLDVIAVSDSIARRTPLRVLADVAWLPWTSRRAGYDQIVSLANFGPIWAPVPHVLFQRNAMYFCRYYLDRVRGRERVDTLMRRHLVIAEMKRADLIVTPSDAMTDMIRDSCPALSEHRFAALWHAVDQRTFAAPTRPAHRGDDPFVFLFPSAPGLYRGLDILIDAIGLLAKRRSDFVVRITAGFRLWPAGMRRILGRAEDAGALRRTHFVGNLPQAEMAREYQTADALVYPSLCESFGFPMVEAMATGLPVAAADTPVNREICSDIAVFYPRLDPAACADAMEQLITDDATRRDLATRGPRRVEQAFGGWEPYVQRFLALCESALR